MTDIQGAAPGQSEITLSIVLPVRNDAPSVNMMVRILAAVVDVPSELIVVYDDPSDTSIPAIESLAPRFGSLRGLLNTTGPGVLNAVRAGVAASNGEYVLIFAADEIGPVLALEPMLELMRQGCDLVSCTRYAGGGKRYGGSLLGHILSRTANIAFRILSSSALTDCTTGIKMFRRGVFPRLTFADNHRGWSFAFEMAIRAQLLDFKLAEVPIVSIDRLFGGQSTFRPIPWIISYSRWFIWGIRMLPPWRRPRPKLLYQPVYRTS